MSKINKVLLCIVGLFIGALTVNAQTITVQASKTIGEEFSPQNIVDGDLSTKWITDEKESAWIIVDLEKETEIFNVWIFFDTRWPKAFDILYSTNNQSWTSIYAKGARKKNMNSYNAVQLISPKEKVSARYLKIACTSPATERGIGICELKLNGKMLGDFSLAAAKAKHQNEPMWNTKLSGAERANDVL